MKPLQRCLAILAITATLLILGASALGIFLTVNFDNSTIIPILKPNYTRKTPPKVEIDWDSEEFRSCGKIVDFWCDGSGNGNDSVLNSSDLTDSSDSGHFPSFENGTDLEEALEGDYLDEFMDKPAACRCDENCFKYGDCCKGYLKQIRKLPEKDNFFRCVRLLNTEHAVQMISKCPSSYQKSGINRALCEEPSCLNLTNINKASCTSLDVPVVNNKTGQIYRNIFCARCHSISGKDIHPLNKTLLCNNISSKKEFEEFQKRAEYRPGKLRFEDPQNDQVFCYLNITDLQPEVVKKIVPEVRFCRLAEEECNLDLAREENRKLKRLCQSYTQVVSHNIFGRFKNPHCAKCKVPGVDFKKLKCERWKPRTRLDTPIGPPPHARMPSGPVGINILFHFSLDMDDNYVGYTSKCEDNEILDFIRHKCVPAICQNGFEIVEGRCEKTLNIPPIPITGRELGSGVGVVSNSSLILPRGTSQNSSVSNLFNSTDESEPCFLLILQKSEYRLLQNGSLAVKKSGQSSEGVILFQPGEYETYNESTMSVCAENIEKTFESSFGPALSYVSTILLGLSVLCSGIHVGLYLILPQMRNLPGNNLLCLTLCLLISQLIFLTLIKSRDKTICIIASVIMHYFFLACFCWMNIMSFDIWRTFSSEFFVRRYSGDSTKTFLKYSGFAWLAPLVVVGLALITEFYLPEGFLTDPEFGPVWRKLRPLYGHNNLCWIGQRLSLFVFFALPVAIVILCNLVLFTLTASTIWVQNREGNRFINGGKPNGNSASTKKSDRIRFKLYAKLGLIMGLTWILGFLSGFTEWEWLWYIFVIFNGLQGTFIFIAFDCKSKIWVLLKQKCCRRKFRRGVGREQGTGEVGSSDLNRATFSSTLRSSSNGHSQKSTTHNHTEESKN